MNELTVKVSQQLGTIDFNFEEIRDNLAQMMSAYEGATFHEETCTAAKGEVATLRKIRKAVEDKRIEVKKECLKPYDEFEKKAKELVALIDAPIALIDTQVKTFEEAKRQRKREEIQKTYDELIGEVREYLPLEKIYDARWENVSVNIAQVKDAIEQLVSSTIMAVNTIKGMNSEYVSNALEQYRQDLNFPNAITAINRYEQQKAEILAREEQKKREAEERRLAAERAAEEEKKRLVEIPNVVAQPLPEEPFSLGDIFEEAPFNVEKPFVSRRVYEVEISSDKVDSLVMVLDSMGATYRRVK